MDKLPKHWNRLKASLKYYLHGIYEQLIQKDIFIWSQAIAFKVLITIVPVVILATGVLGQILRQENAFSTVEDFLRDFLPAYESSRLITFLYQLQDSSRTILSIGSVALIFFAMTLFTTLRIAIRNTFQQDWHEQRSVIGGYLFDLRMVAQVGLLFLLTMGLTAIMRYIDSEGISAVSRIGLDYVWLREGWRVIFRTLGFLVPYLLSLTMFFQLFYLIPLPHPHWRSALTGALVTSILWESAKAAFSYYAANLGQFEQYRFESPTTTGLPEGVGATFGLILAFVLWVYYSGLVLCLGGLIASLYEKRHREYRKEKQSELPGTALQHVDPV